MLRRLKVENYALIDRLELELDDRLNIITGETGAGKSILLGALGLLLGNKNDNATLKDDKRNCLIEGVFDLGTRDLQAFFDRNDLDYSRETTLTRQITPAGKSRSFINDTPVPLALLRELGSQLIDIHSQHQNLILGSEAFRTQAVDTVAENHDLRMQYTTLYERLCHLRRELARLGMPEARFVVQLTPAPALTPTGDDEIDFLFTANGNFAPQKVERIASGGEISRVMLALKALLAHRMELPTIIFDEIDTGVSGRIADAMGEIIADLSQTMQVVDITHLPQVASKGDTHFVVYKDAEGSHIRRLDPEERITEIAKMLSGSQITEAALAQARILLDK